MLKKVIFAAALTLGFVTSFSFGRGIIHTNKIEIGTPAGACCYPGDTIAAASRAVLQLVRGCQRITMRP
jgi:hypothetical protein